MRKSGPSASSTDQRNLREREEKDRVDRVRPTENVDRESRQVEREIPIEVPPFSMRRFAASPPTKMISVDDCHRVIGTNDAGRQLPRRGKEGVDDDRVVKPEMKRSAQDHSERD